MTNLISKTSLGFKFGIPWGAVCKSCSRSYFNKLIMYSRAMCNLRNFPTLGTLLQALLIPMNHALVPMLFANQKDHRECIGTVPDARDMNPFRAPGPLRDCFPRLDMRNNEIECSLRRTKILHSSMSSELLKPLCLPGSPLLWVCRAETPPAISGCVELLVA